MFQTYFKKININIYINNAHWIYMWKQRGQKGEEKRNENREGGLRDRTDEKVNIKKSKRGEALMLEFVLS